MNEEIKDKLRRKRKCRFTKKLRRTMTAEEKNCGTRSEIENVVVLNLEDR
jgi:hypothetical protein